LARVAGLIDTGCVGSPNILFLFTDQQRWDAMGCSGDWVRTPNIDRIASEGVRFADCVTTSPMCVPTRISLALGLYPHTTGVWGNINTDMGPEAPNWMQAIRTAGYRTSVFGKTHLHAHVGDLRAKEHLLHGYGLDDVNEIGGPRASSWTTSHMTARPGTPRCHGRTCTTQPTCPSRSLRPTSTIGGRRAASTAGVRGSARRSSRVKSSACGPTTPATSA
jgi:arylsulfatase A-like enzyme